LAEIGRSAISCRGPRQCVAIGGRFHLRLVANAKHCINQQASMIETMELAFGKR
jgi:hypothetical protein